MRCRILTRKPLIYQQRFLKDLSVPKIIQELMHTCPAPKQPPRSQFKMKIKGRGMTVPNKEEGYIGDMIDNYSIFKQQFWSIEAFQVKK